MYRIIVIAMLFTGCVASHPQENSRKKDSMPRRANISDYDPTPDPDAIVADYEKSVKDTVRIDTTLQRGSRSIHIRLLHYSLLDGALHLPDRYTEIYHLKNYVGHNFVSALKIESDGVKIIDTVIRKELFRSRMQPVINEYAALLYPHVSFREDDIELHYSVSIPLTDVGEAHTLFCSYTGDLDLE